MKNKYFKRVLYSLGLMIGGAVIGVGGSLFSMDTHFESEALPFFIIGGMLPFFTGLYIFSLNLTLYIDLNKIEKGKIPTLAKWHIKPELWNNYLKHSAEKMKKLLTKAFIILSVFFGLIVGGLWIYLVADDRPTDFVYYSALIFLFILGIIFLIFKSRVSKITKHIGRMTGADILITPISYYVDGILQHKWKQFIADIDSVDIFKTDYGFEELVITYLIRRSSRAKSVSYARIPIPPDKKDEALLIAKEILAKK